MRSIFVPKTLNQSDSPACVDLQVGPSSTEMHWHSCAEIIHMRRGSALVFSAEKWETLKEGDTIFLPPGHLHCCHCTDESAHRVVIGFEESLIPKTSAKNDISHAPFYSEAFHKLLIFEQNELFNRLFTRLYELSHERTTKSELERLITVERIFLEMLSVWETKGILKPSVRKSETVSKIQEIIARDFSTSLTAVGVAKELNISYSYMATLLSRELGASFGELLLLERIDATKRMLLTTDMSITEIALEAGFTDSSYFIKKFRATTGTTPYKYRTNNLKNIYK